jgi:hypothetical protein
MALFGDTFSRLVGTPLEASGRALNDARMGEGIRLLERPNLEASFRQGVSAAALAAGVPEAQVAALLPQEELQGALDRLQKRQEKAIQTVRRQEMTVATFAMPSELPTAPSASEQLTSLSVVFARDKEMATRLRDLSFEVAAWEALLKRCAVTLDNDPQLQQSFRRKRLAKLLMTWGLLGVLGASLLVGLLVLYFQAQTRRQEEERLARERAQVAALHKQVAAALALPDPCAPDGLEPAQAAKLSGEDAKQLASRRQRCEEAQKKRLQEQRCGDLATHVASGQLSPDDATLAGAAEAPLRRLATKAIQAADLNLPADVMPCAGTDAEKKLWEQLARAAAAGGPNLWGLAEGVSPKLLGPLTAPGVLHPSTMLAIAFRSEKVATAALKSGRDEDLKRARSMCELKVKLAQALALSCQKVLK